jgi:homoserine kinase type II
MRTVYVLFHQFEFRNTKEEDLEDRAKLIGVYTDEEEAKKAVERVKGQPGFRDYPDGFVIDCYELNQDSWSEGFTTVYH